MIKRIFMITLCLVSLVGMTVTADTIVGLRVENRESFKTLIDPRSLVSAYDYEKPLPIGIAKEFVYGLSDAEMMSSSDSSVKVKRTREAILSNIFDNFYYSIDNQKYYAGAYWERNGDDVKLHILVTDLSIVPKLIINSNIIFHQVKYSYAELENFQMELLNSTLLNSSEAFYMEIDQQKNGINIELPDAKYNKSINSIIPDDSFTIVYKDVNIVSAATVEVQNGKRISHGTKEASIGFPAYDSMTNGNPGWITAGHFTKEGDIIKYKDGYTEYEIGKTTYSKSTNGKYDVAFIKRDNSTHTFTSDDFVYPGLHIKYQEGPTSSPPKIGDYVDYYGFKTGYKYTSVKATGVVYNNEEGTTRMSGVKVNDVCEKGDSGGPVVFEDPNADGDFTAIGIITAYDKDDGNRMIFSRIKEIRDATGFTIGKFN